MAQALCDGIVAGLLLALVAVGFALIHTTTRILHVAHAATYLVGGYVGLTVVDKLLGAPVVGALIALVVAGILGVLVETVVYRPLRRRGASAAVFFLSSLGLLIVAQGAVAIAFGSELLVVRDQIDLGVVHVLGGRVSGWRAAVAVVSFALCVSVVAAMRLTTLGVSIRALAADPELAVVHGLRTQALRVLTACVGSSLAGVAAFLTAYDTALVPISGLRVLLFAVTASVIGGVGSLTGAVLGGLLIGIGQQLAVTRLGAEWQDAIVFLLLIGFLILRPQGLLGRRVRKASV